MGEDGQELVDANPGRAETHVTRHTGLGPLAENREEVVNRHQANVIRTSAPGDRERADRTTLSWATATCSAQSGSAVCSSTTAAPRSPSEALRAALADAEVAPCTSRGAQPEDGGHESAPAPRTTPSIYGR